MVADTFDRGGDECYPGEEALGRDPQGKAKAMTRTMLETMSDTRVFYESDHVCYRCDECNYVYRESSVYSSGGSYTCPFDNTGLGPARCNCMREAKREITGLLSSWAESNPVASDGFCVLDGKGIGLKKSSISRVTLLNLENPERMIGAYSVFGQIWVFPKDNSQPVRTTQSHLDSPHTETYELRPGV